MVRGGSTRIFQCSLFLSYRDRLMIKGEQHGRDLIELNNSSNWLGIGIVVLPRLALGRRRF